jgi:multimeric flavodoxin WrbA
MNALIFDGFFKGQPAPPAVVEALDVELTKRGYVVETVPLADTPICSCKGDFGCWVKTPGVCVIDDEARDIARKVVASDLWVHFTPITFGGPSSQLKKALERIIGIVLPRFEVHEGLTRHSARYKRYPLLLGVGVAEDSGSEIEQIFGALIERNAIEVHCPSQASVVLRADTATHVARARVHDALSRMGVRE